MNVVRHLLKSSRIPPSRARPEGQGRGFLALALMRVLISVVCVSPHGAASTPAVAWSKTLAIGVFAFCCGLHKRTPHRMAQGSARTAHSAGHEDGSRGLLPSRRSGALDHPG